MTIENFKNNIYAKPYPVEDIKECDFYHYMDIPGNGLVIGKWDLRGNVDKYLGNVDFKAKRVLELGTASGFLCFEMEKRGAEIVSYDIGENQEWDMVPFSQYDYRGNIQKFKEYCKRLKNSYWYAHKAYNSKAKAVYGSVYKIPEEIGKVDIATFCCILLHLQNPFLALQSTLSLVKETVIVTDIAPRDTLTFSSGSFFKCFILSIKRNIFFQKKVLNEYKVPYMEFLPDFKTLTHKDTWWVLSPEVIVKFLGILGFEESTVSYHYQKLYGEKRKLFTVVGKRTKDVLPGGSN
ncbi:MAG: methyltransferase domain-containing protein [Candidatus Omnitrophota bacterium]